MKKRILSMALVLCMLLSVVPLTPIAVVASTNTTTSEKDITLGTSAIQDPTEVTNSSGKYYTPNSYIYFGKNSATPIKWRVLDADKANDSSTDGIFLLSEYVLATGETFGNAQTWCKDFAANSSNFSTAEQNAMLGIAKTDSAEKLYELDWGDGSLGIEDKPFLLSARELADYVGNYDSAPGLAATSVAAESAHWWLRSTTTLGVGYVWDDGFVANTSATALLAVRPALNLNLSAVLFTSAAVGGKTNGNDSTDGVTGIFENKNYADITGNDGYKLTLLDENRSGFSASLKSLSGNTATVSYTGATTGTNEYVSVIIKNGNDVKCYGRAAAVTSASGEVNITLPNDFSRANGDVLCVFNEQYNGDKNTDYASKMIDVLFDYTVNFDANRATGTMASQTMTYGVASSLSANTFTRNGYTFNGWNTKADGNGTEYSNGQSVTNLVTDASMSSVTLYAQWKITDYSISYTLNGGTATNLTTYTVESEEITLNNPVKSGYTFTGWSGTGLTDENNMTVTIPKGSTGNRNYTAHYSVKSGYTVSFDVNGGDALADKTGVKWTDKILDVVSTPTRTGYTFKGWKHNNTDITADTAYKDLVANDTVMYITLTAQWEENSNYTVTFNTAGGTSVNTKTNVKWTDKVLDGISEPTRDGYEFTGWKCENVTVTTDTTYEKLAISDTVMTVTLTAQWKDIIAPTGEITLDTNSWKQFLNNITFGLFFKDTQEVTITAQDNSGETVKIEYLLSDKELSSDELTKANFTAYSDKFNIEPNNEYVIYAKLTDTTGNVAYINSNGIVLDNIAPVISGIADGETYCSAQTVTVTEKYADTVTVNGNSVTLDVNGQFTLSPAEVEQKIVVTDKAGNKTEMTVTVNDGHTYEWKNENGKYWQKCTVCDHETDKKDIPEIAINGADKVCNGHDYTFTFTLPEGLRNPTAGYDCGLGDQLDVTDSGNDIYTVIVKADAYKNGYENGITNLEVIAAAETVEGYLISVSKQVEILSGHIGGTATCTEKAVCEICGNSYGALNSSNHVDSLKHTEAKSATTLAEGNIEYWHCENCGKYFSDKDAKNEIQLSDTVVAKLSETDDNKADDSKPSTDNKADNKKVTTENKSSDNKAVKTGDNSHMTAWITLLLASVGLLVVVGVYGRKKKDSKK